MQTTLHSKILDEILMSPLHLRQNCHILFALHNFFLGPCRTFLANLTLNQGWPNILTREPNSRLSGHWRAGYRAVYVVYAKIGSILQYNNNNKITPFFYTFIALFATKCCCGRQVNKRQAAEKCCCTAVHSWKRGA